MMDEIKATFPEFEYTDEGCYIQLDKDDMVIYIDKLIAIEVYVDNDGPCHWKRGMEISAPKIRFESNYVDVNSIKTAIDNVEKFLRDEKEWIQECRDVLKIFSSIQVEFLVRGNNRDVIFGDFTLSNWKIGDKKIVETLYRELKDF